MFQILSDTNIDFMGKRKIAAIFSGILSFIGLAAAIMIFSGRGNLGIDFVGGTSVQLKFSKHLNIEDARNALSRGGIKGADIQEFTTENKLMIKIKSKKTVDEKIAENIIRIFRAEFPDNDFIVENTTEIGPSIGARLRNDTLLAIALSLLGIILYIAIRFDFQFGVAAVVATIHDVLVVIAAMYLLNREFNLLIVTALLTLAGYSLTDTVVIFDRIRENMKRRKTGNMIDLINRAINEVLSRTLITSLTALLVVIALFLFGGDVLRDFSLAMIIGIVIGSYSSLFVASPVVILMNKWSTKKP